MEKSIGVALSGGGFRAAAFHLGTLNKLNELGVLSRVKVISTISGGSIAGAYYVLNNSNYQQFRDSFYNKLYSANVIREALLSRRFLLTNLALVAVLTFAALLSKLLLIAAIILLVIVVWRWQFKIMPVSDFIEKSYRRHFFGDSGLSDFPIEPLVAINATNVQTGRLFTFSQTKMGDSTYAYGAVKMAGFKHENFSIAKAVMASSCVPQFFSPIRIGREFFVKTSDYETCQPVLVDGGIYDNQGIHKLTQTGSSYECDLIITSDAGNNIPIVGNYRNTFSLLSRTSELFMQRIKFLQMMRNLYHPSKSMRDKKIAYFSLAWDLQNCISGFIDALKEGLISAEVIQKHGITEEMTTNVNRFRSELTSIVESNVGYRDILRRNLTESQLIEARKVPTNLVRLRRPQLDYLIRHAENITELQIRIYLPQIV